MVVVNARPPKWTLRPPCGPRVGNEHLAGKPDHTERDQATGQQFRSLFRKAFHFPQIVTRQYGLPQIRHAEYAGKDKQNREAEHNYTEATTFDYCGKPLHCFRNGSRYINNARQRDGGCEHFPESNRNLIQQRIELTDQEAREKPAIRTDALRIAAIRTANVSSTATSSSSSSCARSIGDCSDTA